MVKLFKRQKEAPRRHFEAGPKRTAFSYYAGEQGHGAGNPLKARAKKEQRQSFFKKLRLMPTLVALGVILISIVYSTTLSTAPIVKFVGDNSVYRTKKDYETGIKTVLNSSFWNHSKLTLDSSSTEAAIIKLFPELDIVNVSVPIIGRKPTITVHARLPGLILTTKTNSFVLDTSGKVVANSNQLPSSLLEKLLTAQDQSGVKITVSDQALTPSTVSFINNLRTELSAKQLTIDSLTLLGGGYEMDVHIKNISYYLKTDTNGDVRMQAGAFLAARDSGVNPSTYMDVRVEEKVFYK